MINYTFEVIADMGHGSHVHGEIQVGLSAAEVEVIINYMKEFGELIYFDRFHNKYPELDDKIDQAAQAEIPHMLIKLNLFSHSFPEKKISGLEKSLSR
ncbi:MAG: hypothetical protein PUD23_05335 [Prevotella sp.]|nr:hypothetical protein [Prevotella sp.]